MDNFVINLSERIYEEIQINILKESYNIIIDALSRTMETKKFNKDKECTLKRLHKTIELMHKKLLEQHGELVSENIVQKLKFRMPDSKSNIGQVFCQAKNISKVENKNINNANDKKKKIVFSKEIPNSIEIPKNIFETKPLNLKYDINDYHFFTVNINEENKDISYYLTYAERNKYSKRELIALYKGKEQLELNELPQNIKTRYNF